MRWCWPAALRPRAGNARRCWEPRSTPASATSPPSSSWCGRASPRARPSTPRCSRRKARPSAVVRRSESDSARAGAPICQSPGLRLLDRPLSRADGDTAMATPATTTQSAHPLAHLSGTILLAGAGKMGSALLEGWLALGLAPGNLAIVEPAPAGPLTELAACGGRLNPPRDGIGEVAAGVVAVKPQVAPEVMPALAPLIGANTAVVSIMAGRTLRFLEAALPHAALIRAMPNPPAAIGRGITVAVANARVSREQRALVDTLLSAVG